MTRTLKALVKNAPGRLRYRSQPSWIPPMLATLTEDLPTQGKWIYEPKLDGVRASLPKTQTLSFKRYQTIVAFDVERGITSFSRLQQRMQLRDPVRARRSGVEVHLYLFDCLYYEGVDLTGLPLLDRKAVLRDVVWFDKRIRFTPYRITGAAAMLREACARGAEGILAKRSDSRYVSSRSTDWLKLKCQRRQELVIGGYTAPQGSRERLGALLVGYYDGKSLRYAGKVGTGYDRRTLEHLHSRLVPLHRLTSPFSEGPVPAGAIQWVTPRLVAEIGFSEWTSAGLLRHPRFLGLRDDKPAREVRRET